VQAILFGENRDGLHGKTGGPRPVCCLRACQAFGEGAAIARCVTTRPERQRAAAGVTKSGELAALN